MNDCPTDTTLQAWLREELPPDVDRAVGDHVRECTARCRPYLDGLSPFARLPTPRGDTTRVPEGYELLGELGRGGMGVVYKARQIRLNRVVAVKTLLNEATAGPEGKERFLRESRIVAGLSHANIVQVHEGGLLGDTAYLIMEYVEGPTLEHHCQGRPQPPDWAAGVVEVVARAIQQAHDKGFIHRDLKPANVMLADSHTPKVMDFGLARPVTSAAGRLTQSGAIVGTPNYMAPEQAAGKPPQDVGPLADVWGLGAILYDVLTGRPPFLAKTALDTLWQVLHDEPVPLRRLNPWVPRDLEAVVLKCLEKSPQRRYPSAAELADDLRRFLTRELVRARPVGPTQRAFRWCRRHPALAGLIGTLFVGITVALVLANFWRDEAGKARSAEGLAESRREAVEQQKNLTQGQYERAEAQTIEKIRQLNLARNSSMTAQLLRVGELFEREPMKAWELLHDCEACPLDLRDAAWHFHDHACRRWQRHVLEGHTSPVHTTAFGEKGKVLASAASDGTVRVWDLETGRERAVLHGPRGAEGAMLVTGDGKAVISGCRDEVIRLWDLATGEERASFTGLADRVVSMAASPDGRILVVGSSDGTIRSWDQSTGEPLHVFRGHAGTVLSLSIPANDRLVSLGRVWSEREKRYTVGDVRLWDLKTGEGVAVLKPPRGDPLGLAASARGKRLAVGVGFRDREKNEYATGEVRLYNLETGKEEREPVSGLMGGVWNLAFDRDGKSLIVAAGKELSVWSGDGKEPRSVLQGHADPIDRIALSPDGGRLASGAQDRTVRLWDLAAGRQTAVLPWHYAWLDHLNFSPDSGTLVAAGPSDEIHVWDIRGRQEAATLSDHRGIVFGVAVSPDGTTLASAARDGTIRLRDPATGATRLVLKGHEGPVLAVAFSPDGRTLASGSGDATVRLWDTATGRERKVLTGLKSYAMAIAFSPDSRTLATGFWEDCVRLWDVETGGLRKSLPDPLVGTYSVVFSSDGRTLFTGAFDRKVRAWDVESGELRMVLEGHRADVSALAMSPDGQTLASATWLLMPTFKETPAEVRLWDAQSGRLRAVLLGHADGVLSLAFSPDGRTLASGSKDRTIRLWDMLRHQSRAVLKGHADEVQCLTFTPDGRRLVSGSKDATVRLWDVGPGRTRVLLARHNGYAQTYSFDGKGTTLAVASTDRTVLLDTVTGEERVVLPIDTGPAHLAVSAEGQVLVGGVGIEDDQQNETRGEVRVWDLKTERLRATLKGHRGGVGCVAISPDGKTVASGSGVWDPKEELFTAGEVRLWDLATGEQKALLEGHEDELTRLTFSADGKTLASVSDDETARVWDVTTGKQIALLRDAAGPVYEVALSPDGKLAATGGNGGPVTVWDVARGRPVHTLGGHTKTVLGLAFSPDGKVLATSSKDRKLILWDVATGAPRDELQGKLRPFSDLLFSPDGTVVVASSDKEIHLWGVSRR